VDPFGLAGALGVVALLAIIVSGPIGRAFAERLRGGPRGQALEPGELDAMREELTGLRQQVSELAERQDFTERLLAQARERGLLNPPKER